MVLKAIVMYRGALAQYYITQENEGIYCAHLARYDGKVDHLPPYKLTLIRGGYQWTGNSEDPLLIESIGKVIDKKLKEVDPLIRRASNTGEEGRDSESLHKRNGRNRP
jgi:hypothetical protein